MSWDRGEGSHFTLQLHDHEQSAALSSAEIDERVSIGGYRLHFPKITSSDLDDFDDLLGPERRLDSDRGSLRGSLTLGLSERGSLQGPARLRFDGASAGFSSLELSASGQVEGYLDVDLGARAAALGKLSGELRPVTLRAGDARVTGWWMRFESPLVSAVGWPPRRFTTDLSIVAKNAEPILHTLAKKGEVPEVVANLVSLDNLKVEAKFRKLPGSIDIVLDDVQSDVLDLTGRVHVAGDQSRLALLVGGKHVSLDTARRAATMPRMSEIEFENVTAVAKANIYFDGKVVSHTLRFSDGSKKTLGLIYPGEFHFGTQAPERMDIVAGACRVRLKGQSEWRGYQAGTSFSVPADSGFDIAVSEGIAEYVCSFE